MLLFKRDWKTQSGSARIVNNPPTLFDDNVKKANAARDQGLWGEAAEHYKNALSIKTDSDIAIQLGHCLKEMLYFDEAWEWYRSAEIKMPLNDDLQLQIGHLEKLRGNRQTALHHYHAALTLNPANVVAKSEFANLEALDIDMDLEVIDRSPGQEMSNGPEFASGLFAVEQPVTTDHPVIEASPPTATLMSIGLRSESYIHHEPTSFERDIMKLERALVRGYAPPK